MQRVLDIGDSQDKRRRACGGLETPFPDGSIEAQLLTNTPVAAPPICQPCPPAPGGADVRVSRTGRESTQATVLAILGQFPAVCFQITVR